jgi:hypothetical protein
MKLNFMMLITYMMLPVISSTAFSGKKEEEAEKKAKDGAEKETKTKPIEKEDKTHIKTKMFTEKIETGIDFVSQICKAISEKHNELSQEIKKQESFLNKTKTALEDRKNLCNLLENLEDQELKESKNFLEVFEKIKNGKTSLETDVNNAESKIKNDTKTEESFKIFFKLQSFFNSNHKYFPEELIGPYQAYTQTFHNLILEVIQTDFSEMQTSIGYDSLKESDSIKAVVLKKLFLENSQRMGQYAITILEQNKMDKESVTASLSLELSSDEDHSWLEFFIRTYMKNMEEKNPMRIWNNCYTRILTSNDTGLTKNDEELRKAFSKEILDKQLVLSYN